MFIFGNDNAIGDSIAQMIFHRSGHGGNRFTGADDQDAIIIPEIELLFADAQHAITHRHILIDGGRWIYGPQPGLKDLAGVFS